MYITGLNVLAFAIILKLLFRNIVVDLETSVGSAADFLKLLNTINRLRIQIRLFLCKLKFKLV